jgi:flavorubredoxin
MTIPLDGLRVKLKPSEAELTKAFEFGRDFAKQILA